MTALPYAQDGFGLPLDFVKHTTTPDYYNGAREGESEADFVARCATELEALILAEGPNKVGALFAEPVMGAGGVIIPPAGYFAAIRAVLHKYEVLLVADEVICGFGRTGNMWGSETMDVQPDMLTCAKALSSAYLPISAVMLSDHVYGPLAEHAEQLGISDMATPIRHIQSVPPWPCATTTDLGTGHHRPCSPHRSGFRHAS